MISCIHGAAAMLEDDEALNDRKTERVRILCDLLDHTAADGRPSELMKVFVTRSHILMRQKEAAVMTDQTARGWLNDAANIDSVIKAGTLRLDFRSRPKLHLLFHHLCSAAM